MVELSLLAWEPVFASLEGVLGPALFGGLNPGGWRETQRRAVENVCASKKGRVWIAEVDGVVAGFVATETDRPEQGMGETTMLAVHPDHQGTGVGASLTDFALESLKEAGMEVAMVETGGDPGHAAARRTYEKAGYTLLPIARYFKKL